MSAPLATVELAPMSLPPLVERRLDNGLNVIAAERGRVPLVAVALALNAGSARDPRGKAGLSDFTLELLRRGTTLRPAEALNEALELMGAELRLETSPDATYLSAVAPSEHAEPLLGLIAELLRCPAFAAKEVAQARQRTVAQLKCDLDEASVVAGDAIARVAFGKHPYARPGRGTVAEVESFTRADCVAQWRAHLRPDIAWLAICSDLPADDAHRLAARAFGAWEGRAGALAPLPLVSPIAGSPILVVNKPEANQAQLRIASLGPSRKDPDLIAARLSNQIFGGSFSSRLMDAIRVERGLTYGVSSFYTEGEAGGLTCVSSFTKTETARALVDAALSEAERYRAEGPSAEELLRAQRYANGLYPLSLETADRMARAIADTKRLGRDPDWLERYRERIASVSADQARELGRRHLLAGGLAIAAVGPARALADQLAELGKVKVVPVRSFA